MTTAHPMTTRAPVPSLLIMKKQQGQWDHQQPAFMSIMIIKRCHCEHLRNCVHETRERSWRRSTEVTCCYSGTPRNVEVAQAAHMGWRPTHIGLYRTAVVQGLSSLWAWGPGVVYVSRKRTPYVPVAAICGHRNAGKENRISVTSCACPPLTPP